MTHQKFDRTTGLFLVAGVVLALVSNGRWILPLATWLAPIGWLVFLDRTRLTYGLVTSLVAYILITMIAWQGLIPAPGLIYYLITFVYALVYFSPFAIHRLLAHRLSGILSTLVFPLAWVGIEFIFHRWITPYGSWFSLAYTQTETLAFLQVASITGIAGISFMIVWFASIAACMMRPVAEPRGRYQPLLVFGLIMMIVVVYGEVRMAAPLPVGPTLRSASLVPNPSLMQALDETLAPARRGESFSDAEFETLRSAAFRLNADLIERTRREAEAGAGLIAWAETAGRVLKEDESDYLVDVQNLAAELDIILMIGYGVFDPDDNPPLENKVAAIDRSGNLAWQYQKAHPIVGAESGFIRAGDGIIRVLQTDYGRMGAVICHDLDFPELLLTAARLDLDLVVAPSADWPDITPLHANMALLRSIEGGFSLLRPTSVGRSLATDHLGRAIAVIDFTEDVMVAQIAPHHTVTIYRLVGDLFAWLCIAAFFLLLFMACKSSAVSADKSV